MELIEKIKSHDFGALFRFKRSEVSDFFKDCRSLCKAKDLVLLSKQSQELEHGKLLPITSRKVGKAVARNRLRRLAKNIFIEQELYKHKYRLVLIFKPKCQANRALLEGVFQKAKLSITNPAR